MKLSLRCFCLLLCLVSAFAVFSVTASAEEVDSSKVKVNITYNLSGGNIFAQGSALNGTLTEDDQIFNEITASIGPGSVVNQYFAFYNDDGSVLFEGGKEYTFEADNFRNAYFTVTRNGNVVSDTRFSDCVRNGQWRFLYADGTYQDVQTAKFSEILTFNSVKGTFKFNMNFKPDKDVTKLYFYSYCTFAPALTSYASSKLEVLSGFWEYPLVVVNETQSEEEGLLSGILGSIGDFFSWIKNAWNGMTSWLSDIFTAIKETPQKIGEILTQALKDLFVPDDDYIIEFQDHFEQLLADKFGAVYQVVQTTFGAWEQINFADQTDSIDMPEVTINLPDDNEFSFGGMEVKIVPDGFEFLVDILKLAVGMVCTIMFINGLRKRYDEVMGVEQ